MDVVNSTEPDWVVIGRFGRPHGVKGLVTVYSFTEPKNNIIQYPWYIRIKKELKLLEIQKVNNAGKYLLALVNGYNTREEAACLTNIEIIMPYDVLPALNSDEFYWHELIGMKVVNHQGIILGRVESLLRTIAHDSLIVTGDSVERVIPYINGQTIIEVDREKQSILVDWDAEI